MESTFFYFGVIILYNKLFLNLTLEDNLLSGHIAKKNNKQINKRNDVNQEKGSGQILSVS